MDIAGQDRSLRIALSENFQLAARRGAAVQNRCLAGGGSNLGDQLRRFILNPDPPSREGVGGDNIACNHPPGTLKIFPRFQLHSLLRQSDLGLG